MRESIDQLESSILGSLEEHRTVLAEEAAARLELPLAGRDSVLEGLGAPRTQMQEAALRRDALPQVASCDLEDTRSVRGHRARKWLP